MKFCILEDQIADIFTKPLSKDQFERNRMRLGLIKLIDHINQLISILTKIRGHVFEYCCKFLTEFNSFSVGI